MSMRMLCRLALFFALIGALPAQAEIRPFPSGFSVREISANGTTIDSIPFYLDNPANPYPNKPACIYQSFPVNASGVAQVTYPMTTDIDGWKTSPPVLNDVVPESSYSISDIQGIRANVSSGQSLGQCPQTTRSAPVSRVR